MLRMVKRERLEWDLSQMDASGFAERPTMTGETLTCLPVGDRPNVFPGQTRMLHEGGFVAMIGTERVGPNVWDMPDGAMDEAMDAYEKRYPVWDVKTAQGTIEEGLHKTAHRLTACGFIRTAKTITFSVWGKGSEMGVYDLIVKTIGKVPVRVKVTEVYSTPKGATWWTVVMSWVY